MADTISARLDDKHIQALETMTEHGDADTISEALRDTCAVGLTQRGYLNGVTPDTPLRQTSRRFADAFALLALFLYGVTFIAPVGLRVYAVAPLTMSIACYGLDRLLKRYEPAISGRLKLLNRSENA